MDWLAYQIIIPFVLSALVVIGVSVIAERLGTKLGGILGTLPSTIVIAFIFISINKGNRFASSSAAVVPAEMGINIVFLTLFAYLSDRKLSFTVPVSLGIWGLLSAGLFLTNMDDILISMMIYTASLLCTLYLLENKLIVKSVGKVDIEYTLKKMMFRGLLAGTVIAIAVFLSNIGSVLSGIFSVFPAIFLSTLLIFFREHGKFFVQGMAKSMLYGTPTVVSYAVAVHFLYPRWGMFYGTIFSYLISLIVITVLLKLKDNIK